MGVIFVIFRDLFDFSIHFSIFHFQFICTPAHLNGLTKTLSQNGYSIENSEHMFTPNVRLSIEQTLIFSNIKLLFQNLIQLSAEEQKIYNVFLQKLRDVQGMEDIYDNVE